MDENTADYWQIQQTFARFAAGIDMRDWALYRSVFTPEIDVDYSSYRAGSSGRMSAEDWVERARRLFPGLEASQHFLSNLHVTPLSGQAQGSDRCDAIEGRMYLRAEHVLMNDQGDDVFTIGGYYTDRFVRTPGGWLISGVTLTVLWNTGNRHVLTLAAERVAAQSA